MTRSESSAPAPLHVLSAERMSKKPDQPPEPELRDEYDFSGGERGRYSARFAKGSNVVVLDPDVAEMFPDAEAVNQALKVLARAARDAKHAS